METTHTGFCEKKTADPLLECLYSTPDLLVYKLMYLTILSDFLQSEPLKKKKKNPSCHPWNFRAMFPAWKIWSRLWVGVGIRTSKQTDNM